MESLTTNVRFGYLREIVFECSENGRSVIGYEVAIGSLHVLCTDTGAKSSPNKLHLCDIVQTRAHISSKISIEGAHLIGQIIGRWEYCSVESYESAETSTQTEEVEHEILILEIFINLHWLVRPRRSELQMQFLRSRLGR